MLRNLFIVLIITIIAAGCLKNDSDPSCPYTPLSSVVPANELADLETFLDTNGIVSTKHPAGFYYYVSNAGTGTDTMGLCSTVDINYDVRLVTDSVVESQLGTPRKFFLGGLIEGFQKGIPLVKKGGQIKLYLPPKLGYGSTVIKKPSPVVGGDSIVVIPANSILIYNVKLVDYTQGY